VAKTIHPTAKVLEQINRNLPARKCRYNF